MHPPGRNGSDPINSYALVTYLPEPVGTYFDIVRRELEPDAPLARSHVTLLPPRPVTALDAACEHLRDLLPSVAPISVDTGEVVVFPVTSVIYVSITAGTEDLIRAHRLLNSGPLAQVEAFDYCPHITLAQSIPRERIDEAVRVAQRRWADYRGPRRFLATSFTFVQNTTDNRWVDLESISSSRRVASLK